MRGGIANEWVRDFLHETPATALARDQWCRYGCSGMYTWSHSWVTCECANYMRTVVRLGELRFDAIPLCKPWQWQNIVKVMYEKRRMEHRHRTPDGWIVIQQRLVPVYYWGLLPADLFDWFVGRYLVK